MAEHDCRNALIGVAEHDALRAVIEADLERRGEGNLSKTDQDAIAALNRIKETFDAYEPATIERAQELCSAGEVEVDDGAVISRGDDSGAYVMAWLWVPDEESDKDEDEDED